MNITCLSAVLSIPLMNSCCFNLGHQRFFSRVLLQGWCVGQQPGPAWCSLTRQIAESAPDLPLSGCFWCSLRAELHCFPRQPPSVWIMFGKLLGHRGAGVQAQPAGSAARVLPSGCCRWWQVKDTEREREKRRSYLEKLNDNMPYPDELRDWHQEWVIMGHQVRMLSEEQRVPCGQIRWWKGGWESVSETPRGGEWRPPHTEPWWGQVPSGRGIAMALIQEWLWGKLPTHRERSTCQTPLAQLECTMAAQPF